MKYQIKYNSALLGRLLRITLGFFAEPAAGMDHYNTARLKNAFLVKAVGLNNESWIKQQVSKRNSSSYQISVPSEQTLPSGKTLLSCSTSALPGTELSCFSSVLSENVNSFSSFFFPPSNSLCPGCSSGWSQGHAGQTAGKINPQEEDKKITFYLAVGEQEVLLLQPGL